MLLAHAIEYFVAELNDVSMLRGCVPRCDRLLISLPESHHSSLDVANARLKLVCIQPRRTVEQISGESNRDARPTQRERLFNKKVLCLARTSIRTTRDSTALKDPHVLGDIPKPAFWRNLILHGRYLKFRHQS